MGGYLTNTLKTVAGALAAAGVSHSAEAQQLVLSELKTPNGVTAPLDPGTDLSSAELTNSFNAESPSSYPSIEPPVFSKKDNGTLDVSFNRFYLTLLKNFDGIYIGDCHGGGIEKQLHLEEQMELFASLGVRHFYLEAIRAEDQDVVDSYNLTGGNPYAVMAVMERHGLGVGTYFPIVEAANKAGIKVFGIDLLTNGERCAECNWRWAEVIQEKNKLLKPGEKYLVLGGKSHAGYFEGDDRPAGVDRRLSIPSVFLHDAYREEDTALKRSYNNYKFMPEGVRRVDEFPQIWEGSEAGHTFSIFVEKLHEDQSPCILIDTGIVGEQPENGVPDTRSPQFRPVNWEGLQTDGIGELKTSQDEVYESLLSQHVGMFFSNVGENHSIQSEVIKHMELFKDLGVRRIFIEEPGQGGFTLNDRFEDCGHLCRAGRNAGIEIYALKHSAHPERRDDWLHYIRSQNASLPVGEKFLVITDSLVTPLAPDRPASFVAKELGVPLVEFKLAFANPVSREEVALNTSREIPSVVVGSEQLPRVFMVEEAKDDPHLCLYVSGR